MKELYPWISVGVVIIGFIGQGLFGSFRLGRAVEQMKAALKQDIKDERDSILERIEKIKSEFLEEQRNQDHNFGEVGAAMRQYIADVEKKVREVEIYGRDHYVQKSEFDKATNSIRADIREMAADIKTDLRTRIDDLSKRIGNN
jgi:hypothetical protein